MDEAERRRVIRSKLAAMDSPQPAAGALATGFTALDSALGGGLPRGRMVEFFGPAGCGKTTLAIQVAGNLQKAGLTPAWIDAEHTFDPGWAARLGVAMGRMPLSQPQSAEQALAIARTLAASGAVELVILDSAAALVPALELTMGAEAPPGLQSRVMESGLRKLSNTARRAGACVLFLNQMRNRLHPAGTGRETSAGGAALKLQAAVRLMLIPGAGSRIALVTLKNKAAESVTGRELEWRQGAGFVESP
jgi:recombination protein RecA